MESRIYESGIHCYNPTDKAVVLINTISRINVADQSKNGMLNLGLHQLKISGELFKTNKS